MIPIQVRYVKTRPESESLMEQERVEGQNLNDSYLVRYVKTRPESESFMEQERVATPSVAMYSPDLLNICDSW